MDRGRARRGGARWGKPRLSVVVLMQLVTLAPAFLPCRDNVEDALQKLQGMLDAAWQSTQPIKEDPEKKKQINAQLRRVCDVACVREVELGVGGVGCCCFLQSPVCLMLGLPDALLGNPAPTNHVPLVHPTQCPLPESGVRIKCGCRTRRHGATRRARVAWTGSMPARAWVGWRHVRGVRPQPNGAWPPCLVGQVYAARSSLHGALASAASAAVVRC